MVLIGALAVLGTVVGVAAAAQLATPSSMSSQQVHVFVAAGLAGADPNAPPPPVAHTYGCHHGGGGMW